MSSFASFLPSSLVPLSEVETNVVRITPRTDYSRDEAFLYSPPIEECLQDPNDNEGGLCQICRRIDLRLPGYRWIINGYGTPREIFVRQHCAICRLVLWILAKDMGFLDPAVLASNGPDIACSVHWIINPSPEGNSCLTVLTGDQPRGFIMPQSIDSPALKIRRELIRLDRQDTVAGSRHLDIRRIRAWIDECERLHTGACGIGLSELGSQTGQNLMLIDVDRMQLIEATSAWIYVALSYVWGRAPTFKTTQASLGALQQEKGVSSVEGQLPRVVRDSIRLVLALGERYLWVDSLCIVQDDAVRKHEQISQMDAIYGHAYLTIVAMAGETANSPLPGVDPNTRMAIPPLEVVQGFPLAPKPASTLCLLSDSVYNSRAWTFQERLLSKRCLFFTQWAVYYQCCQAAFAEDEDWFESQPFGDLEAPVSNSRFKSRSMIWNPFLQGQDVSAIDWVTGFTKYGSIVTQYTDKQLSYPSDILNAFRGIGNVLEHQYGSKLIKGLPEAILDLALLWSPADASIRRRKGSGSANPVAFFPSWSWAGWQGNVKFALPIDILEHRKVRIEIGMFNVGSLTCSRLVARQMTSDSIEYPVCPSYTQDSDHVKSVDEYVLHFWAASSETKPFRVRGQQVYHLQKPLPATRILDDQGRYCGLLLVDEDALSMDNWDSGSTYELVLLSTSASLHLDPQSANSMTFEADRGFITIPIFDWRAYEFGKGEWDVVNFMLIEWSGDFAERVAIGCMHKDAWMNVNRKRRYVKLV